MTTIDKLLGQRADLIHRDPETDTAVLNSANTYGDISDDTLRAFARKEFGAHGYVHVNREQAA
ncbi:hypothetical protein AB0D10_05250 [Kitasatospora sp. NPDC048545]|uniref:hypothetical protein n=1 Tax=Kitasatospora sp. NPDC048545 TaxID=3157208 RepID=UPI0033DA87EB